MLADKEFLEKLLEYIGNRLKHEVKGLLIGGNAMILFGLRGHTKDLDIVFYKREDIAGIIQIIQSHPLYKKTEIVQKIPYKIKSELLKKGEPTIIKNSDIPRFDLFYKYVFSVNTERIFQKAKRSMRFDLLHLKLIEPENLIFLKAVTSRPIDKEDIVRLIKNLDIDWNVFLNFAREYYKKDNKPVWFALGTFYDINQKEKIIPKFVLEELAGLFNLRI